MNVIFIAGGCILLLNVLFSFFFYSQLKRKLSPESVLKNIRLEINRLIKEIDASADRDISILEQRSADLSELLQKADGVSQIMRTLIDSGACDVNRYTAVLEAEHEPPLSIQAVSLGENSSQQGEHESEAPLPVDNTRLVIPPATAAARYTVRTGQSEPVDESDTIKLDVKQHRESVVLYATQGFSSEVIADRLHISRGEVELILSMAGI